MGNAMRLILAAPDTGALGRHASRAGNSHAPTQRYVTVLLGAAVLELRKDAERARIPFHAHRMRTVAAIMNAIYQAPAN